MRLGLMLISSAPISLAMASTIMVLLLPDGPYSMIDLTFTSSLSRAFAAPDPSGSTAYSVKRPRS